MSDIKCPVCNVGYVHESVNHWCCDYEFCPSYNETDTETYDVLIRTREALNLAFEMLKDIKNDPDTNDELTQEIADRLFEIETVLEQKDTK